MQDNDLILAVQRWVGSVVVEHDLCPFARREIDANRVRFVVTRAATEIELLNALSAELEHLTCTPSIETTLIIHPHVLSNFLHYNQFLDSADRLLSQSGLEGTYQIASFHPDYQFAGTAPDDAENFTNRSPYPVLHLLREESLEKAIAHADDIEQIPVRNIETMNRLGTVTLRATLQACFVTEE
ncbi:MAG: DUF1415 domain-containing protein [Gammaproteobacteria bacterium]|nr:DUF1415 domain-containing protein [Gammaproteobacteria bacterium]